MGRQVSPEKKMINKILFLMERFCDADPKCGPSNSEHQVVGAIESTGLVKETKHFYFDVLSKQFGQVKTSEMLLEDITVFQPDLIIYTPLGGALGDQLNPLPQTIRRISDERKLFLYLFDAKPACGLEVKWLPLVNYLGIADSISAFLHYRTDPRVIMAFQAASPGDFYNKNLQRDIDVSFIGSIDPLDRRWPLRHEYTKFLKDNGVNIWIGGGQRGQRLSVEEYCNILNHSKISLSFCRDGNGLPILKQKVFEIMSCEALLLEDYGTDAAKLFCPDKDFVIFHSKEELLRLVKDYLVDNDGRETIARSGHEKVTKVYNVKNVWGYVFNKMGLPFPHDDGFRLYQNKMEELCLEP